MRKVHEVAPFEYAGPLGIYWQSGGHGSPRSLQFSFPCGGEKRSLALSGCFRGRGCP